MAHDGSLASLIEDWIVTQVAALAPFADGLVEPFRGTTVQSGEQLIDEMTANRNPYAAVLFEGDTPRELEEGQQGYEPTFGIYIVVQNEREGTARRGDGTTPGTNLIRDLMRNALHDKEPALGVNGYYADRTEFKGVKVVFQRRDAFILRAEVSVRESPSA